MIVTDKKYFLETKHLEKLNLICDRCSRNHDALLLCDGDEGFGKTTLSGATGYYVAHKLGRPFSVDNFFFDLDEMIKFAISHEQQVIIWDEAALGGLASDWNTYSQRKLMKMLMVARKKRHFYIFNIPRCFKLNEYVVIDRAIGLMHVYSRDGITMGRFTYYKNSSLEKLYFDWRKSRRRSYKKFFTFHSTFPNILSKVIDINAYEKKKDEAILKIGDKKEPTKQTEKKLYKLQHDLATKFGIPVSQIAKTLGFSNKAVYNWRNRENMDDIAQNPLENSPMK